MSRLKGLLVADAPSRLGGGFSPVMLKPALWLTAAAGLFQDSGGSTPAAADGDVVGLWRDQSGGGWHFSQATTAKKPVLKLGANGLNGRPAVLFDGLDDLLVRAAADWLSASGAGDVLAAYDLSAALQNGELLTSSDEATSTSRVLVRAVTSTNRAGIYQQNAGDTGDSLYSASAVTAAKTYITAWRSSGADYTIRANGAALALAGAVNNGDWFADTSLRDNLALGAVKDTSERVFFKGRLAELLVFAAPLAAGELALLEAYLNQKYAAF